MKSTIGIDFVYGFINNDNGNCQLLTLVSNGNDQPTNVTITSIYPSFQTINLIIQANTVEKVQYKLGNDWKVFEFLPNNTNWNIRNTQTLQILITPSDIQARYDDFDNPSPALVIENKGIRIQSTLSVAVYAFNEHMNGYR
jgi:hypothetical protein